MNSLLLTVCSILDLRSIPDQENGFLNNQEIEYGSLGLFQWNLPGIHTQCVEISDFAEDVMDDRALSCARWAASLGLLCGTILLTFIFCQQYLMPLPCSQCFMDMSALSVQICLGLAHFVWYTDVCFHYQCSYGPGMTYLISAQGCWFFAGFFSRCMRPGRWDRRDEIKAAQKRKQQQKLERQSQLAEQQEQDQLEDAVSTGPSVTSSMAPQMSVGGEQPSTIIHHSVLDEIQEHNEDDPDPNRMDV